MRTIATSILCIVLTGCAGVAPRATIPVEPVPDLATAIVPLFMAWVLEGESLPGQPLERRYLCRGNALQRLREAGHETVLLEWNAEPSGDPLRFRWKYQIDSRLTVPLTAEERTSVAQRLRNGQSIGPQAEFHATSTDDPSRIHVDFFFNGEVHLHVGLILNDPPDSVTVDPVSKMLKLTI